MLVLTLDQLRALCPYAPRSTLALYVAPLQLTLDEFEIDTLARSSAFLAQVAHESGGFRYVRELASGADYEGNQHLGNVMAGDGPRFKGRGLIQITGRKNYGLAGEALGLPLLEQPQLLEQPKNACRSAGWFWTVGAGLNLTKRALDHGVPPRVNLNELADQGDFDGITLAVNGGLNGAADRLAYFQKAQSALGSGLV